MGNFCCCSFPKTKILVQKKYNYCKRCEKENNRSNTRVRPVFFKDDFDNVLDKNSYIIFICPYGHMFEFYGEKNYLRWIWSQDSINSQSTSNSQNTQNTRNTQNTQNFSNTSNLSVNQPNPSAPPLTISIPIAQAVVC